jgi:hypothetical protein
MSTMARSQSGSPPSGFSPPDPRLRRGTSVKASASPPQLRDHGLPMHDLGQQRPPIVTRAESAPCTCPEHCERDHEND